MRNDGYNQSVVSAYYIEQVGRAPMFDFRFHPVRRWEIDLAWPTAKGGIGLEVQGGIWIRGKHGRGSGIKKDMEKHNALLLAGWKVLHVEPKEVCMLETAKMVKQLLETEDGP